MKMPTLCSSIAILILLMKTGTMAQTRGRSGIQDRFAEVNDVRLHYLVAGKGNPVIFIHGYAETSHSLMDGLHVGRYLARIEQMLAQAEAHFD